MGNRIERLVTEVGIKVRSCRERRWGGPTHRVQLAATNVKALTEFHAESLPRSG
jgi:hypothetical protein